MLARFPWCWGGRDALFHTIPHPVHTDDWKRFLWRHWISGTPCLLYLASIECIYWTCCRSHLATMTSTLSREGLHWVEISFEGEEKKISVTRLIKTTFLCKLFHPAVFGHVKNESEEINVFFLPRKKLHHLLWRCPWG